MDNCRNISDKFKESKTVFSIEFFPPKTEEGARQILRTANQASRLVARLRIDNIRGGRLHARAHH